MVIVGYMSKSQDNSQTSTRRQNSDKVVPHYYHIFCHTLLLKRHYNTQTRLGQLGANISPDRSSLMPQVLIGNFLCKPFVVCHKSWEKLYELQHINLLSLYLPKEDGVSPDVEYITQQSIFSIFLQ